MSPFDSERTKIDALIKELYSSVCFGKGEKPPLEKMRRIFTPDGKTIVNDGSDPVIMGVEDYINMFYDRIRAFGLDCIYEIEIWSRTDIFEKIAHRLSTYELKTDLDSPERLFTGINSIQLINIKDQWFVNSMIWNKNSKEFQIPAEYLG